MTHIEYSNTYKCLVLCESSLVFPFYLGLLSTPTFMGVFFFPLAFSSANSAQLRFSYGQKGLFGAACSSISALAQSLNLEQSLAQSLV